MDRPVSLMRSEILIALMPDCRGRRESEKGGGEKREEKEKGRRRESKRRWGERRREC